MDGRRGEIRVSLGHAWTRVLLQDETLTRPQLIKKKELARALGVSFRTIDTWVAQRVIPTSLR